MRGLALAVIGLCMLSMPSEAQYKFPDPDPGSLLVGYAGIAWPYIPVFNLCPRAAGDSSLEFELWARTPEVAVRALEFDIVFPGWTFDYSPYITDRTVTAPGASDVSVPGDDHWVLQFEECLEPVADEFVPLVTFKVRRDLFDFWSTWVCMTSADNLTATWTDCAGNVIAVPVYPPAGLPHPGGCFTPETTFCPVDETADSWSRLKARF